MGQGKKQPEREHRRLALPIVIEEGDPRLAAWVKSFQGKKTKELSANIRRVLRIYLTGQGTGEPDQTEIKFKDRWEERKPIEEMRYKKIMDQLSKEDEHDGKETSSGAR